MVKAEFFTPSCLATVLGFGCHEVLLVFVIAENMNLMLRSFKIGFPFFES
jgi:hypothetical protein